MRRFFVASIFVFGDENLTGFSSPIDRPISLSYSFLP